MTRGTIFSRKRPWKFSTIGPLALIFGSKKRDLSALKALLRFVKTRAKKSPAGALFVPLQRFRILKSNRLEKTFPAHLLLPAPVLRHQYFLVTQNKA